MAIRETSLEPFGDRQVWVQHVPLRFFGLQMGTRMTVVRLDDGSLFVHSPTAADKARRGVDELGPVRFIIAPNRLHHLWLAEWAAAYPHAQLWGSPKLLQKRKDIAWTGALGDAPEAGWAAEVDQTLFGGYDWLSEVVFYHRASRTLIVADLLESTHADDELLLRVFGHLAGDYERPTLTRDQRRFVRDRAAARSSVRRILSWDFERIILAHGRLVEHDGRRVFREGMRWLGPLSSG
jgi:Domain of unknown function (DUF4336)